MDMPLFTANELGYFWRIYRAEGTRVDMVPLIVTQKTTLASHLLNADVEHRRNFINAQRIPLDLRQRLLDRFITSRPTMCDDLVVNYLVSKSSEAIKPFEMKKPTELKEELPQKPIVDASVRHDSCPMSVIMKNCFGITVPAHSRFIYRQDKCKECDHILPVHFPTCSAAIKCACGDFEFDAHKIDCPKTLRCSDCGIKIFHQDHLATCDRFPSDMGEPIK